MKHLFIINPCAGRKTNADALRRQIDEVCRRRALDYEIYITKAPMDAADKVRSFGDVPKRVYACGGDGTLNEVVCGAAGLKNTAVTHYPIGTGNDFIRCFGESDALLFRDLDKLISGEALPLDLIKYNDRCGINICSVGIDARVARDVHRLGDRLHLSGRAAYNFSLLHNLIRGINSHLTVRVNGEELTGSFALVCICSGRFYGGGYNPVPEAVPDDGALDILVINGVSLFKAADLIGRYSAGRYREMGGYARYFSADRIELESDRPMCVNIDGETDETRHAVFSLIPGGIDFVFPEHSSFYASRYNKIEAK